MLSTYRIIFLIASFICASSSMGLLPERFVEGTHYRVLEPAVPTNDPSKIEVVGAFWYGCPHCYSFEPLITDWVKNADHDVDFVRFPAVFGRPMDSHGQIYFTAVSLGVIDKAHEKVYEALVKERKRLQTEGQIAGLFAELGVARDDFQKSFNSFSVRTKLEQAKLRTKDYGLQGTPSMIVNGKYVVIAGGAVGSQQEVLDVIDFLIQKERNARLKLPLGS